MVDKAQRSTHPSAAEQYCALLAVSEAIISHRDLGGLFRDLAERLSLVISFDYISVLLYDAERGVMRLRLLETPDGGGPRPGWEAPVEGSATGWAWQTQVPLVVHDIKQEKRFPLTTGVLRENGVNSLYVFPLTPMGRRLGTIGFGHHQVNGWGDENLEFIEQVVKQVAVAVDNALNFESARSSEQKLARERDRSQLLLGINNAVVSRLDLRELLQAISDCLRKVIPHDFASLMLYDSEDKRLRAYAVDFLNHQSFVDSLGGGEGVLIPLEGTHPGLAFTTRQTILRGRLNLADFPAEIGRRVRDEGGQAACHVPLIARERTLGVLSLASLRENAFTAEDAELLEQIAGQVAIAAENALAYREIETLKNKLADEKLYLEEEIQTAWDSEQIIGNSPALKRVLKQVETVAPTDSTVLIRGETGTGKELIARAIHNLSGRRERTLVKLNCAAIPTGLLESELFGHERGAFTGAIAQRIGRFELANRGTLFLDEVGDIPLELQPKLLRVLQEQEFERLGSARTQRVDVRLVAATNSDLEGMVADKRFRGDLFYRLNVFPVTLPPLRERREDIPQLVRFFAQRFARRMSKPIETIPAEAMSALVSYSWPGNVRELENIIERAAILSRGAVLEIPIREMKPADKKAGQSVPSGDPTLEGHERAHILHTLEETDWVVGGPAGAAARLGMKRTTLQARMHKLGISRHR